jgi:hypothetical protein
MAPAQPAAQSLPKPKTKPSLLDQFAPHIARHERVGRPRYQQLWDYYRNPITSSHSAWAALGGFAGPNAAEISRQTCAQERGLPSRFRHKPGAAGDDRAWTKKEIVIENDIAWRIQTQVDFMFGRPIGILSLASDPGLRRDIERALDDAWEASGGIALLQDIGLIGHVYGHVDLIVRDDTGQPRVEVIEPTRGIPIVNPWDYRALDAYLIRSQRDTARPAVTEILQPGLRALFIDDALVSLIDDRVGDRAPGAPASPIPVVHIQNLSQPFHYEGVGEVEPLIPLQDELNTRLSDRASRVTFQSFKMFLAKGIDPPPGAPPGAGASALPVGPGQIWTSDNPDAEVVSVGGDAASPSEERHIDEIREALDKQSGVPPLAAGVVRAKIGNLTSENALRVTLMGLLSKTARKRVTYGRGIAQASRLMLDALDRAGVLRTDPADRAVRIEWPDPLPRDESDVLNAAIRKLELGVPRERVLAELGYAPTDPGIV